MPDATTLLKFRRLLLEHDLTPALFEEINAHLAERGLLMRAGTIVDATIISAPHSNVAIVRVIVRFSPDILPVIVEASAPHNNGLPKAAAGR